MKKLIATIIAAISLTAYAHTLYLTINNESNSETRVTTGRLFSHTYDVQSHASESHWYFTDFIWNVKAYYKAKDGAFKKFTSCKTFAWYDKSLTFEFYNVPGKDEPLCQIKNY